MQDYRITFSKTGSLSFISHLDFNHSFIRILKRAGLPLRYSEGFNPRPKIVFGLPLSVGMEGLNELVDISLTEELSNEEVEKRLKEAMPPDITVKSVETPLIKLKYIELAEYEVFFPDYKADSAAIDARIKKSAAGIKALQIGRKADRDCADATCLFGGNDRRRNASSSDVNGLRQHVSEAGLCGRFPKRSFSCASRRLFGSTHENSL